MENTIIIAIVSLLCILAHVPTLILRIVPFHEKISDKDRIRLTVIYAIGLAVDFGICMCNESHPAFTLNSFGRK